MFCKPGDGPVTVMEAHYSACIVGVFVFDCKACNEPGMMGVFVISYVVLTPRSLILNGLMHRFALP